MVHIAADYNISQNYSDQNKVSYTPKIFKRPPPVNPNLNKTRRLKPFINQTKNNIPKYKDSDSDSETLANPINKPRRPLKRPRRIIRYGDKRKVIQIDDQNNKKSCKENQNIITTNNKTNITNKLERSLYSNVIYIYTDGAVSNNHNQRKSFGGIGVYWGNKHPNNVSEKFILHPVTNQRTELYAIIRAFQAIIKDEIHLDPATKIIIYTDSMYALNIITKRWRARDNLDLVHQAWDLLKNINNLEINHIRAHTKNKDIHSLGNYMADTLARAGKNS